jgi:hypothetical protein
MDTNKKAKGREAPTPVGRCLASPFAKASEDKSEAALQTVSPIYIKMRPSAVVRCYSRPFVSIRG